MNRNKTLIFTNFLPLYRFLNIKQEVGPVPLTPDPALHLKALKQAHHAVGVTSLPTLSSASPDHVVMAGWLVGW